MSEKRILIQEIDGTCIFRELHETCAGGFCEVDLMCAKQKEVKCDKACFNACTKKVLNGISRTEAVKVMGPAIYRALNKGIALDKPWEEIKKEMAEAALDALLEKK